MLFEQPFRLLPIRALRLERKAPDRRGARSAVSFDVANAVPIFAFEGHGTLTWPEHALLLDARGAQGTACADSD